MTCEHILEITFLNKLVLFFFFFLHTVKWFQAFLFTIIHLFAHLNGFRYCYITVTV